MSPGKLARPLAVFFLVAIAIACRTKENRSPEKNSASRIRIGHFPNLTHAPALLARSRGDFERALAPAKVEWLLFSAGPQGVEAIFAGEVDLLYVGPGPALSGFVRSGGRKVVVLAGSTSGGSGLVLRKEAGIDDPAKLGGKRIATPGTGNTQDIALRCFLQDHGLVWSERGGTVRVVPIAAAEQLSLFRRGELDGSWAVEPWLSRLVVEGGGELRVDEGSLWPGGIFPTTLLIARPEFTESEPDLVRRAQETHRRSVELLESGDVSARKDVEKLIAELTGKSLAPAVLAKAWTRLHFTIDPMKEALVHEAGQARRLGYLPDRSIDFSSLFFETKPGGSL